MLTPVKCDHTYGFSLKLSELITEWTYHTVPDDGFFTKFTYCPWCRTPLHTLDGIVLGLSDNEKDDCEKGGCAD